MIHWVFLILAFFVGLSLGIVLLYRFLKLAAKIESIIEEGTRASTL